MCHLYKPFIIKIYKITAFFILSIFLFRYLCPLLSLVAAEGGEDEFIWPTGPSIHAAGAIVMEASTGMILYEKDIYSAYYPASITKVMTALLALENCSLDETITMSHEAEWGVDFNSSRIGLIEGEQISLENGLYAVMLESANEVSYCVGEHVAGGKMSVFAEMMNERVKELGGVNSNFTNPHGLHDDNHYTCAYDMALISRAAISIPEFKKISGTRTHQIPETNKNVLRYLANHHRFIRKTLNYDGTVGGKTGGTEEAKTTLVTFAEKNGMLLIAVVLYVDTALHAYEDTAAMLDFCFDSYNGYNITQTENLNTLAFPSIFDFGPFFMKESKDIIYVSQNSKVILPKPANFDDADKSIIFSPLDELVHGENVIGRISYTYAGRYVGSTDIIYYNKNNPVTKAEFLLRWPKYLILPEEVSLKPPLTGGEDHIDGQTDNVKNMYIDITLPNFTLRLNKTPLLIGIAVTIIVLITGMIIAFKVYYSKT